MKKIVIGIFMVFVVGCSNDDKSGNDNNSSTILIKKIITNNGSYNYLSMFSYNGNKISEIKNYGDYYLSSKEVFTYTGDLITKIIKTEFNFTGPNDDTQTETFLEYDIYGKIILETILYDSGTSEKIYYNYGQNGTITTTSINNIIGQNLNYPYYPSSTSYAFSDNLLVNDTKTIVYSNSYEDISNNTYIYDNKNSPYKNIVGFNALFSNPSRQKHNLLKLINKITYKDNISNILSTYTNTTLTEYYYNSEGYPTESYSFESNESNDGIRPSFTNYIY